MRVRRNGMATLDTRQTEDSGTVVIGGDKVNVIDVMMGLGVSRKGMMSEGQSRGEKKKGMGAVTSEERRERKGTRVPIR